MEESYWWHVAKRSLVGKIISVDMVNLKTGFLWMWVAGQNADGGDAKLASWKRVWVEINDALKFCRERGLVE